MRMSYEYLFQLKLIKNYLVLIESSKYLTCVRYKVRYKIKKTKQILLFIHTFICSRKGKIFNLCSSQHNVCVLRYLRFMYFIKLFSFLGKQLLNKRIVYFATMPRYLNQSEAINIDVII